jgi:hypothetical protein
LRRAAPSWRARGGVEKLFTLTRSLSFICTI